MKGASNEFDKRIVPGRRNHPVFFRTALGNFGVDHMLDGLVEWAPAPMPRNTDTREVTATEEKFTGFVFKIQANMDPKHRDRVAFMRVVSGKYEKGMKLRQVRIGKDVVISDALTLWRAIARTLKKRTRAISSACITTAPFRLAILYPV